MEPVVRIGALVVLLVTVAGCVPLAEHPAGDEQAAFDGRLQGIWRPIGGGSRTRIFIGAADDAGRGVRLATVEETSDRRWKVDEYTGVTNQRGKYGYLSMRYQTTDGERRGWVIARYTLTARDRLQLTTLDEKRLATLVRAGTLAGRVSDDGPNADVDLTMSAPDLVAFLDSKDGQRLFGDPHVLMRIDSTSPARPRRAHQSTAGGVAPMPSR